MKMEINALMQVIMDGAKMNYHLPMKHTLATFLSKELDYCREDILEALHKFEEYVDKEE